jgi:DNA recombination protein RmuC
MDFLVVLPWALVALGFVSSALVALQARRRESRAQELEAALRVATEERARLSERALRLETVETECQSLRAEIAELRAERARLQAEGEKDREAAAHKIQLLEQAEARLKDAFDSLSSSALERSTKNLLELAKATLERQQAEAKGELEKRQVAVESLVRPIRESLERFDGRLGELEKAREGAYQSLSQQVRSLLESEQRLLTETANLAKALGSPKVRGRWGEIQLRRVVELAGMLKHCDFTEQTTKETEEGRLRPDLVIRLPGGKSIVVDAKVPLNAYLEAIEAPDDRARQDRLRAHAGQVREHLSTLGRKSYWAQFQPAPEIVVLFLPAEQFFTAALEFDGTLIEKGVEEGVIVATPTTLIALLKAVAFGWRQESLAENAAAISELGKELYKRVADLGGHFGDLGGRLGKAVESYNKAVATLESRVLVTARKFRDLESSGAHGEIEAATPVESAPRQLQAPEVLPGIDP